MSSLTLFYDLFSNTLLHTIAYLPLWLPLRYNISVDSPVENWQLTNNSVNMHYYIWSFIASESIVLIGEVDRHFTSAPAVQCPTEELCQVWFVVWSNNTDSCCWMEYVNHTGRQFWNNLIVFWLGWEKLQMFCAIYKQLVNSWFATSSLLNCQWYMYVIHKCSQSWKLTVGLTVLLLIDNR